MLIYPIVIIKTCLNRYLETLINKKILFSQIITILFTNIYFNWISKCNGVNLKISLPATNKDKGLNKQATIISNCKKVSPPYTYPKQTFRIKLVKSLRVSFSFIKEGGKLSFTLCEELLGSLIEMKSN